MEIKQYHIYQLDLANTVKDDELPEDKVHAVILSPDVMNEALRTIVIAPLLINSKEEDTPTTFSIDKNTKVRLDQISSLSKTRIEKYIGKISENSILKIKNTISEMLVK